jgi:indole-3-glycerol phosphate synthase
MLQTKILEELAENKKNQKIGAEVFSVSPSETEIKHGLSVKEIIREMKKASKENLIRIPNNASFC